MKQFIITIFITISSLSLFAQDFNDALRYADDNLQGTSRFQAMGGAFGALGGDLSAFAHNPAGSAVYNYGQFGISVINRGYSNNTLYTNSLNTSTDSNTDINQIGFIVVLKSNGSSNPWNKISFGFNYDQNSSFDNIWRGIGRNSESVSNYFISNAQGKPLNEISALEGETLNTAYSEIGYFYGQSHQQAFLGFESFIIDPIDNTDTNTQYVSNLGTGEFNQNYYDFGEGNSSRYTFNIGTQYKDKLQLGLNLNYHYFKYSNTVDLIENNSNADSRVTYINFSNYLFTIGDGISLQIGGIYKVTESLRLGLNYKSPTWFTIEEQFQQSISTNGEYLDDNDDNLLPFTFSPNTINLFDPYNLRIPSTTTASAAYVFGEYGLLSIDYSYKDYSNLQFGPSNDPYFRDQNQLISSIFKPTSTLRLGTEFRFQNLSVRGGYVFQETPYKDKNILNNTNTYSFGFGYNLGASRIDFVLSTLSYDENKLMKYSGISTPANIRTERTNFGISFIQNF